MNSNQAWRSETKVFAASHGLVRLAAVLSFLLPRSFRDNALSGDGESKLQIQNLQDIEHISRMAEHLQTCNTNTRAGAASGASTASTVASQMSVTTPARQLTQQPLFGEAIALYSSLGI